MLRGLRPAGVSKALNTKKMVFAQVLAGTELEAWVVKLGL